MENRNNPSPSDGLLYSFSALEPAKCRDTPGLTTPVLAAPYLGLLPVLPLQVMGQSMGSTGSGVYSPIWPGSGPHRLLQRH